MSKQTEKRYPFSMRKCGHNIELAYNHQWIICREMEDGEREWNNEAFKWLDKLSEVYANAIGSSIYYATGEEIRILKEASLWAECYRDSKLPPIKKCVNDAFSEDYSDNELEMAGDKE